MENSDKIRTGDSKWKENDTQNKQIIKILNEAEAGVGVTELSRQHGFSQSAFYKWKAKYGGMDVSQIQRLKELEEENRKLKQMYADLSLEHKVLKDIVEKKLSRWESEEDWPKKRCRKINWVSGKSVDILGSVERHIDINHKRQEMKRSSHYWKK